MLIECSDCNYKYLVNSADLKPDGRMVECANCNYQWFQEPSFEEDLLSSAVPTSKNFSNENFQRKLVEKSKEKNQLEVKNLPSTVVQEQKVSLINSLLVVFFLISLIVLFLILRSYGTNIFVLINFYIHEFFFNLKLIIDDIAKIIYQILN